MRPYQHSERVSMKILHSESDDWEFPGEGEGGEGNVSKLETRSVTDRFLFENGSRTLLLRSFFLTVTVTSCSGKR